MLVLAAERPTSPAGCATLQAKAEHAQLCPKQTACPSASIMPNKEPSSHLWPARRHRAECTAPAHPPAAARIAGCGRCRRAPAAPRCSKGASCSVEALGILQCLSCKQASQPTAIQSSSLPFSPDARQEPFIPVVRRQVAPGGPGCPELRVSVKVDGNAAQCKSLGRGRQRKEMSCCGVCARCESVSK